MKKEVKEKLSGLLDTWSSVIPPEPFISMDTTVRTKARTDWFGAVFVWTSFPCLTTEEQSIADEIKGYIKDKYQPRIRQVGANFFRASSEDIEFVETRLKKMLGRE